MSFFGWLEEQAPIIFGLVAGTIAHFGSRITRKESLGLAYVVGYLMQLGVIGLFAASFTEWLDLKSGIFGATFTAIFAMSTQEVVEWGKRDGWKRILRAFFPTVFEEPNNGDTTRKDNE